MSFPLLFEKTVIFKTPRINSFRAHEKKLIIGPEIQIHPFIIFPYEKYCFLNAMSELADFLYNRTN